MTRVCPWLFHEPAPAQYLPTDSAATAHFIAPMPSMGHAAAGAGGPLPAGHAAPVGHADVAGGEAAAEDTDADAEALLHLLDDDDLDLLIADLAADNDAGHLLAASPRFL